MIDQIVDACRKPIRVDLHRPSSTSQFPKIIGADENRASVSFCFAGRARTRSAISFAFDTTISWFMMTSHLGAAVVRD
jgi:hypothetical protein